MFRTGTVLALLSAVLVSHARSPLPNLSTSDFTGKGLNDILKTVESLVDKNTNPITISDLKKDLIKPEPKAEDSKKRITLDTIIKNGKKTEITHMREETPTEYGKKIEKYFDLLDLNKDGKIDRHEFKYVMTNIRKEKEAKKPEEGKTTTYDYNRLTKVFGIVSKDKGYIVRDDIEMCVISKKIDSKALDKIIEKIDPKKQINKDEFLKAYKDGNDAIVQVVIAVETLEKIDFNKDGVISRDELKITMTGAKQNLTDKEFDALFKNLDKNKDGKINLDELCMAAPKPIPKETKPEDLLKAIFLS